MNKTEYWICDKCGKKILSPDDGWVEWLVPTRDNVPERHNRGLRIVHRIGCLYTDEECLQQECIQSDYDLTNFVGDDGLMELLELLSDDCFENKEEVLEIIKRIHISGYEEARPYINDAICDGVYEPNTKENYCSQKDIEKIIQYSRHRKQNIKLER